MDPKNAILILGLLAMVLLISSQVSARDLAETSPNTEEVNDAKYGHYGGGSHGHGHGGHYGGGGHHGGHYGGGGHHGGHGVVSDNEVVEKSNEVNDAKYGHYGGGHYGGGHYGGGHYGGGGGHYGGGHGASDNGN